MDISSLVVTYVTYDVYPVTHALNPHEYKLLGSGPFYTVLFLRSFSYPFNSPCPPENARITRNSRSVPLLCGNGPPDIRMSL